ncbi:hypothetical protein HB884_07920 [Listeria booriae]|uniref:hypothetical protein n=1 Tax=Listeria booriae TaxID=1552123 RepID=UPI001627D0EF|nr:hypothetical protein [Listeria booriae]MBC1524132.1 hypothetical protein [Listeria booriae]
MSENNSAIKIGDEVKYTDIVTIIDTVDDDAVEVRTDAGYSFWTTRDNLDK